MNPAIAVTTVNRNGLNSLLGMQLCFPGFPGGSVGKESVCSVGELGSIPESGRSPGEGNGNALQCPYMINPKDRGAWGLQSRGSRKSRTQLSDYTTTTQPDWCPYEKERLGHRETPAMQHKGRATWGRKRAATERGLWKPDPLTPWLCTSRAARKDSSVV